MDSKDKTFVVVMRGSSAVVFKQNDPLVLQIDTPEYGVLKISYATRWITRGENITSPGQMWIEIRGKGDELEKVLNVYGKMGMFGLALLSVAANAAIGDVELELGYETTRNIKERDYFQRFLPNESGDVFSFNKVNVKATLEFMSFIRTHNEQERIFRAANQYRLALDWWKLGGESMCIAHLWMAIEALTKAFLREELIKYKLGSPGELANKLKIDIKQLDANIRKDLILKGDEECYKKALDVSNGIEHGYLNYDVIRDKATDIRPRLAKYVRDAILELSGITNQLFKTLTTTPYDKPSAIGPLVRYLRGKLIGEGEALAKEGSEYPFVHWKCEFESFKENEQGKFDVSFNDELKPELAQGIGFKPMSHEVWKLE